MSDEPVLATKDHLGEYDAIESAKPGEPLFPIQGGDPFGPKTILYWADLCRTAGRAEENVEKARAMLRKAADAELVAWTMTEYQKGASVIAEQQRATYTDLPGTNLSAEQAKRVVLIRGASILRNALSQIADVAAMLNPFIDHTVETGALRKMTQQIGDIAELIEPRRGNERT
jgi:hypothetical protein